MNSKRSGLSIVFLVFLSLSCVHSRRIVPDDVSGTLIQQQNQITAVADAALVGQTLGSSQVDLQTLKSFVQQRTLNSAGTIDDLVTQAACIIRLEQQTSQAISASSLEVYLNGRGLETAGSKDDLFSRSCDYLQTELQVQKIFGRGIPDITVEELKVELSNLGIASGTGTKFALIYSLGKASKNVQTIKTLLNDPTFNPSSLKALLKERELSQEGTTAEMLTRLATHLLTTSPSQMIGASAYCDLVTESSICLAGGKKMIIADAVPRGLVGRWTFDDENMFDSSGNSNHVKRAGTFTSGIHGFGQSASFDGNSMIEIPHSEKYSSNSDFCVTYWFYLLTDSTGQWRTILHKGSADNERTPTFFLEPQTRGIEFFVSTTDDNQQSGERVWSNTFIPLKKWTHIAGCLEGRNLRLFINGILDAENTTIGTPISNQGSIFIGNDPWRPSGGVSAYLDELKFYSRVLTVDEIQAEAQAALGLVEPSFVELGCMSCSLDNCAKTCREGFRLCTRRDLYSGGYFIARSMGWATGEGRIWKAEDGKEMTLNNGPQEIKGLCMCCRIAEESA